MIYSQDHNVSLFISFVLHIIYFTYCFEIYICHYFCCPVLLCCTVGLMYKMKVWKIILSSHKCICLFSTTVSLIEVSIITIKVLSWLNSVYVVLQGFWHRASWGFPKGKINVDEEPHKCAIREVCQWHSRLCTITVTSQLTCHTHFCCLPYLLNNKYSAVLEIDQICF